MHAYARPLERCTILVAILLAPDAISAAAPAKSGEPADVAAEVLKESGVRGGFIVHLHCGDGRLTSALRASDSYQVHGLDTSPGRIAETRAALQDAGVYGPVSVERFNGKSLPYVDNMVNLVVAEKLGDVPQSEIERVLCPRGVVCIRAGGGWKKIVKPVPQEIDDWTHYLHDAVRQSPWRTTW